MASDSRELLDRYRDGDDAAAAPLFERYSARLLALVRSRLSQRLQRRIDPEDVVQSAYRSFFVHARAAEFTAEEDGDLWRLLDSITLHKLWRQAKHHRARKRALDRERHGVGDELISISQVAAREPTVADVVLADDELRWLLEQLEPLEQQAVKLRIENVPLVEITARLEISERTIRRWLAKAKALLVDRGAEQQESATGADVILTSRGGDSESVAIIAPLRHEDYKIERLIGSGGMAKVYAAVHRDTGARVALKVLRKRLRGRRKLVEQFMQEATIAANINHPAIVRVQGLGRLPDGNYFLVMDLVEGSDLAKLYRDGPCPPRRAMEIVAVVAEAIQHAHEHGVVHRDLKPGNVLVDKTGRIFIADFGFACFTDGQTGAKHSIVGTAGFMAPEQLDSSLGPIGPHTDVYGLGALLHALLYGHPPGDENIFDGCLELCRQCLETDRRTRPPSAAAMATGLRSILAERSFGEQLILPPAAGDDQ